MTINDDTTFLLHDAIAYLQSKSSKFSNINLESIKHFYFADKLKVSVKLENAIGRISDREYQNAQIFKPIYDLPDRPSIEKINFPHIITVDLTGIGSVFHGMRHFLYEDKEYVLDSCSSRTPVILKTELDRFISTDKDKSINKKIRKSSRTVKWNGRPVTPATKEKYERWQEAVDEKHKSNPSYSHTRICMIIAKDCGATPATLQRVTSLKTNY